MKIIDGKLLAENLNQELGKKIAIFTKNYRKAPCLVVILVGDDPASNIYVKNKEKKAFEVGITSHVVRLKKNIKEIKLLSIIQDYNDNNKIDGILVQLPLPNHINSNKIIDKIDIRKDVDGFNSKNIGLLALGRPEVIPCTPLGCYKMLEKVTNLEGKKVVILGRSNIVGKPLAYLLTNKNATVTLTHSKTKNIKDICISSDIIIAAIGKPNFVKYDWIKKNAIVIDVGINVINNKSKKKILGDVDFESVVSKVKAISPVPGGVGPMTIHCLLLNTYMLANLKAKLQP